MDEAFRAGKFREFGVSNFRAWQLHDIFAIMKENNWSPLPTVYQGAYNAVQRDAESDLLPLCRLHGMRYCMLQRERLASSITARRGCGCSA